MQTSGIRLAEIVFEKGLVSDAVNRLIAERWPIKIPRPADDFVENLALIRCPETLKRLQHESYCSAHALLESLSKYGLRRSEVPVQHPTPKPRAKVLKDA
jgi:hypothetical protein